LVEGAIAFRFGGAIALERGAIGFWGEEGDRVLFGKMSDHLF